MHLCRQALILGISPPNDEELIHTMKMRKGFKVIWDDAMKTEWLGDCPKGEAQARAEGRYRVVRILISGSKRWPCTACNLNMHH